MLTGWQNIEGDTYYFRSWGAGAKGWNYLSRPGTAYAIYPGGDYWHYFDDRGKLLTDSDSMGCSEGFNTWNDTLNETIAANREYNYYISGCSSYQNNIHAGVRMWQNSTDVRFAEGQGDINLVFGESSSSSLGFHTIAQTYFYYFDEYGDESEFWPWDAGHNWVFSRVLINSDFSNTTVSPAIIAHEIGHTFGLSHQISDVHSVMSSPAWGTVSTGVTERDIMNFNHLYH